MKAFEKKYSVSAFIDILGYKDLILKEANGRENEVFLDLKETMDLALSYAAENTKTTMDTLDKKYSSTDRLSKRLNVKQFSDNIFFSFDYSNDDEFDLYFGIYVISTISYLYQRLLMAKGYFVRGGIANGLNMVDKNFIFSTALIKAVETEKNTVYPRITFHKDLRDIYINSNNNPFRDISSGQFAEDWAEQVFINPFYDYNMQLQQELEKIPEDDIQHLLDNLSNKQQRLINKLNHKFADFTDEATYNSIVRKQITQRIKKYKNKQQNIYEKYLWSRNFLNFADGKKSDIYFKYI